MRSWLGIAVIAACGSSSAPEAPPPKPAPADAAVTRPVIDAATGASAQAGSSGPAIAPVPTDPVVDGAALRAKHRARLAADTSPVTVLTGGTARELGQRLCEAVVPRRPPATPVLVKPNMSGFNWFKDPKRNHGDNGVSGRTTDPEFVRGIVACLKARGHTRITIADGFTGVAADWKRLVKVSGYAAMAAEEKVPLVALDDDGVFDIEGDRPGKPLAVSGLEKTSVPTLLVPKLVAEHLEKGLFISAPKLKTHRYSVISVGIKGMQGTAMYSDASPAFRQKWRTHKEINEALALLKKDEVKGRKAYVKSLEAFAQRMADILELEAPDAVLAEGAPAMTGDGFDKLFPTPEPVAIGGTNAITVDRIAAQYLGLWDSDALAAELGGHRTSPLLEAAAKHFGVDIKSPAITGDGAGLLASPRAPYLVGMADFEVGTAPDREPGDPADAGGEEKPAAPTELHARATTAAPAIDGAIDDAWKAAPALTFATNWAGRATKTPTTVRALWSPTALYLLFELANVTPFTDTARAIDVERTDLYQENCVELFLVPDPANLDRYFEIEIGPHGHYFDLLVDKKQKPRADPAWSADLKVATARDDKARRAVIEVAIEAPDVAALMKASAALPLGVYRMEGKGKRQYLAAFPTRTQRPNFHVPERFGKLVLDPP